MDLHGILGRLRTGKPCLRGVNNLTFIYHFQKSHHIGGGSCCKWSYQEM